MGESSAPVHRPSTAFGVSLVAIGDELLNGKITDTNSSYIAKELRRCGIAVRSVRLIGDNLEVIVSCLQQALAESNYVICTGGLGPTSDDLTRDAISALSNRPLVEDAASRARLADYCAKRNRPLNQNNLRQVVFPKGAKIIENQWGTADSFETSLNDFAETKRILALPGVPREMRALLEHYVVPRIKELFPLAEAPAQRSFRLFGIPESLLGEKIDALQLDEQLLVSYRPQFPEILLELAVFDLTKQQLLDDSAQRIREALGEELIFSENPADSLAEVVARLLSTHGKTIACAESCSGGMLADAFVSYPGASTFFRGSVVAYANALKESLLGVPPELLSQFGAVSEECATVMASEIRSRAGTDYGLAITGIAGPNGGTTEKPVGTVWVGFADAQGSRAQKLNLQWDRDMTRRFATSFALSLLRHEILALKG